MMQLPKPPKHLKRSGKSFWKSAVEDFDFQDFHLRLLCQAAECLDRIDEARDLIKAEGLVIMSSQGRKYHPALTIEKDQKKLFAQLVRELRLDHNEEPKNPRRPEITEGR